MKSLFKFAKMSQNSFVGPGFTSIPDRISSKYKVTMKNELTLIIIIFELLIKVRRPLLCKYSRKRLRSHKNLIPGSPKSNSMFGFLIAICAKEANTKYK